MSERTVFLVYGYDNYEYPCNPIKAFSSEDEARKLLAEINAYAESRPPYPSYESTDGEYDAWTEKMSAWRDSHPASYASSHDGFAVMDLTFQDQAND
jgi:hypothetical protein